MKSYLDLSWQEFDWLVLNISKSLNFITIVNPVVVGISRGGLPLATALAHRLLIKNVYDDDSLGRLIKYHEGDIILCDDICDSGQTMSELYKMCPTKIIPVALIQKVNSNFRCRAVGRLEHSSDYIVFPWETDVSTQK